MRIISATTGTTVSGGLDPIEATTSSQTELQSPCSRTQWDSRNLGFVYPQAGDGYIASMAVFCLY